ncbi:MAG: peptidylprolyl isomerase [Bacteroidota bacterium]
MALIGKIRKNNWLLIVAIGLGLAAFIMMDSMSGDRSIGATAGTTIGNIGGNKISYPEFDRIYQIRSKNFESTDSYGQRASVWNYLVEKTILEEEAEDLGIGVSSQELIDLQFNPATLSPLMAQRFPAAGGNQFSPQPDMQRIQSFQQAIEAGTDLTPEFIDFWKMHEGEVRKDRVQTKLNTLVSKSMYTPTWMVEKSYAEQNQAINFNYVKIPFDEVDDSEVTVEDSDLSDYLKANAAKYMQDEATRKLGYVVFDVIPTVADSAKVRDEMAKLGDEFAAAESDSNFVENNYGQFRQGWLEADNLNESIQDFAFTNDIGAVSTPYLEGRAYKVAKILDRRVLPDSAKCRHILINDPNMPRGQKPFEAQYVTWEKTVDSLKTVLENGTASFDSLALKYSNDPGSKNNGGVYEHAPVNQYVPEFNDVVFYKGELNKLYSVRTQFGVHLIEPLERKNITNTERVKVAYVSKNVIPSRETTKNKYKEATAFIKDNADLEAMKAAAEANNDIEFTSSNPVKANDYNITGLGFTEDARRMVKFAFENSVGEISSDVYAFQDAVDFYDNKYVVAGVESIQPAGKPSLEDVRETITPIVRNMKKGEKIKAKINAQDLASIAASFEGISVDTASAVRFNASSVPGLGQEPKVIASAFNLEVNSVSQPIVGDNGVYVVQTTLKPNMGEPSNLAQVRKTIRAASQNQVPTALMAAMKKNTDIDDKRSKFY